MTENSLRVTLNLEYGSFLMDARFAKYADNDRTALIFEDIAGNEDGYIDGSVNIHDTVFPESNSEDYIIVKSYAENEGMLAELIRHGIIEEYAVNFAFSGHVVAPVHKLTDKAIEIRDAQFKGQGIYNG